MRSPPAAAVEEPPEKELARLGAQAIESTSGDPQRDDARPFGNRLDDPHPVAEGVRDGDKHPEGEE